MKKLLLLFLMSIILMNFSFAQNETNQTINNQTNQSNQSDTNVSPDLGLEPYKSPEPNISIFISDFERLNRLTEELISLGKLNAQEKEFLNSLSQRLTKQEERFIDTLDETQLSNQKLIEIMTAKESEFSDFRDKTEVRIDTFKTQLTNIQKQLYYTEVWVWVRIIISFITGMLILEIIHQLYKGKRLYFVLRWIRNRIPIKF